MKGTEKQIAWAEDIIDSARRTIDGNVELVEKRIAEYGDLFAADLSAWRIMRGFVNNFVATIDSAAQVIDKRHILASAAIVQMANRMGEDIRTGRMSAAQIADKMHVTEY